MLPTFLYGFFQDLFAAIRIAFWPTLHTISAEDEDEDVVVPACAGSRASKLMVLPFMRRQMHFRKSGGNHSVRFKL